MWTRSIALLCLAAAMMCVAGTCPPSSQYVADLLEIPLPPDTAPAPAGGADPEPGDLLPPAPANAGMNDPTVYSDPGTVIRVAAGERFIIALEANPSTGYQWQLAQPLNEAVATLVDHRFEPAQDTSGTVDGLGLGWIRVGVGGTDHWTFEAVGAGTTTISLEYVRPWQPHQPEDTRIFSVTVE